jgi:hypothetical protein
MESLRAPRDRGSGSSPTESADEAPSPEGQSMARGWPSWAVELALFALVLVILVGAFFLNDRLKPKVGTEPVSTAVTSTRATAISSLSPTVAGAVPATTLDPNGEKAAVVEAYLHYWDVYTSALISLDSSHLSDVMDGDELKRVQAYLDQLKAGHQALKIDVSHHYEVTSVTPDTATLDDELTNRSYLVDSATTLPLGSPEPAAPETIACRFQLENGVWKVTSVIKVAVTVVSQ